jgi:hypothetical protein
MTENYSDDQVREYLAKVDRDIAEGRIDANTCRQDFSFHQARIESVEFDIHAEELQIDVRCEDWLKRNSGISNPHLPHRLVFRDVVQIYYRNRLERTEPKIFELTPLVISERLIEAKELYRYRVEGGGKPIALEINMPLEDTELVLLCSDFDIHVGERIVTVVPE